MIDFDYPGQLVARLSARIAFRGGGRGLRPAGGRGQGVVVRGSFRYHKGRQAVGKAGEKMEAHLRYQAGERKHQKENGTSEKRELFDERGQPTSAAEAAREHEGAFIEHRLVLSPGDMPSKSDLHAHAQASIRWIREQNPDKEVRATYAIHTDTDHPHVHLLITSPNRLRLEREDYQQLREFNQMIKSELQTWREWREAQAGSENFLNLQEMEMQLGR